MRKLDIWHHKIIVMLMMLLIFIGGVFFGVHLSGTTEGTQGLEIIIFAMLLVSIALSYITFMQVIHVRDDIEMKRKK
jgi:hypothetical protein